MAMVRTPPACRADVGMVGCKEMSRHQPGSLPARDVTKADVATETTRQADEREGTVLALYVTGPKGGARHILPEGLVRFGRDSGSTVPIDDPRVSRAHAALYVGRDMLLTDLGSANGTFLGTDRLKPGDARPVSVGQTFFLGDSALVVRSTSLLRACSRRVTHFEDALAKLAAFAPSGGEQRMVVVKVRPLRSSQASAVEAILGELLASPADWMLPMGSSQLLLGIAASAQVDAREWQRKVLQRLASWSALADVDARLVSKDQLEGAGEGLRGLFDGDIPPPSSRSNIVMRDPAMLSVRRTVARVAPAPVNVLILGETGSGKDVVATMVHELSTRARHGFVRLNCASLPEQLLESELFGHERGAFTGAVVSKPGLLETAQGGTVFLDEVGELPLAIQAKLLRAIESREVLRVGGLKSRSIDVRFVAATNRDLARDVAEGRFRQDLYYRLNCVTIMVPPLRERPSEIEPLARMFLESARGRFGVAAMGLSPAAIAALTSYGWPGNARELRNVIERAVLLTTGPLIEPAHLALPLNDAPSLLPTSDSAGGSEASAFSTGDDAERERLAHALLHCGGNQSRAAKFLGIPRRTLVRQIARLGLPRPRRASDDKPPSGPPK
jgi:DNA-binding NtrC family response regulator/pSer/pThr/pTyr-binding forkhead associated (FHA) protein